MADDERAEGEGMHEDTGGGEHITVNSTDDPDVEGGYYQSQTNADGDKQTAVYDSEGDLAEGKGDNDEFGD